MTRTMQDPILDGYDVVALREDSARILAVPRLAATYRSFQGAAVNRLVNHLLAVSAIHRSVGVPVKNDQRRRKI